MKCHKLSSKGEKNFHKTELARSEQFNDKKKIKKRTKKILIVVGFEPTPQKRLVPKTSALDLSATLPAIDMTKLWQKTYLNLNRNECEKFSFPFLVVRFVYIFIRCRELYISCWLQSKQWEKLYFFYNIGKNIFFSFWYKTIKANYNNNIHSCSLH